MSKLDINTVAPSAEDTILAEWCVSDAWLRLQQAMMTGCRDGAGDRRVRTAALLDALNVQAHVAAVVFRGRCEADCWVCKRDRKRGGK